MNTRKDLILAEIVKVFGSQKACADALNMTEGNFSHALNRLSKKFLLRLATVGIVINENNPTVIKESIVTYQATKIMQLEEKLKELETENKELRDQSSKDIFVDARERLGKKK